MEPNDDELLHLSLLSRPDAALSYVELLQTGKRPAYCQRMLDIRSGEVKAWREMSAVYDAMCQDAEEAGTGTIDDAVVNGVLTYQPGWSGAAKLVLQRRDEGYADKSKVDRTDNVHVIERVPEEEPDEWEKKQ